VPGTGNLSSTPVGLGSVKQQQNPVAPDAIEPKCGESVNFQILFNIRFAFGIDILSHQQVKLTIDDNSRIFLE